MRLIVQKWAQLTCYSLLTALPPLSSASALLGAPPRSAGTEHCMLESNAMQAFHWSPATRFRAIFFLGPVVFLLWPLLYMYWLCSRSSYSCIHVYACIRTCIYMYICRAGRSSYGIRIQYMYCTCTAYAYTSMHVLYMYIYEYTMH